MNSKMLLAFVGGLIVASGVTYIAMKRTPAVAPETTVQTTPARDVTPAPVQPEPAAAQQDPTPAPEPQAAPPRSGGWKPSPARERAPRRVVQRAAVQAPRPAPVSPATPPAQPAPMPAPVSQPAVQTPAPPPIVETAKVEPPSAPAYEPPSAPKPNTVTVPAGTPLTVRLSETLSSERNQSGDQFSAVLDQPLVVDGFVIAERGARAHGRIVELERSGRVRGVAKIAIELTQIKTSDGQNVKINTGAFSKQAETTRNKDAAKVGVGAALGAAIGAIAGGGKGAAIGAGAGGAAGAGDVALTRGAPAELRVETRVSFRLSQPVTLTERLQ